MNRNLNAKKNGTVKRRVFLKGTAGTLAAATLSGSRKSAARSGLKKPKNLIFIVADSFRADHLGCYGSKSIKTPYLDKLSKESVTFENSFADGLPTIPCRRVYHTGKTIIPMTKYGGWIPLLKGNRTIAQELRRRGFVTGFIADTYHYFKPNMNFHQGFNSWQWVRGQEMDSYRSGPVEKFNPKKHMPAHLWNPTYDQKMRQFMMNTQDRKSEEDYFCARTLRSGLEWLKRNSGTKPFMLWLDTFDPHEPWDAPKRFQEMYHDNYPAERTLFGYGVRHKDILPTDYPFIRGLYAAECTFVDMWVGRFVEGVRQLGLLDDTILVFTTDHGTHLGEEGCVQKTKSLLNCCLTHLPLIVRHPDRNFAGKRVKGFVGAADYMPSFLDMLGVKHKLKVDGKSFWPLIRGEKEENHKYVISEFGSFASVRDHHWCYFQDISARNPLDLSIIKNRKKDIRMKKLGVPHLYDLKNDPGEKQNVVLDHLDIVEMMQGRLKEKIQV